MIKITILTPTYNRANCLPKLFESLTRQTNRNFQWLVIDDGSSDNTVDFLKGLCGEEHGFKFAFYTKSNGGKHTALNYSHPYIKGEWTCIVDSDDYLADNAVEEIIGAVNKYSNLNKVRVLSFLRGTDSANPLNKNFPEEPIISNHIDFRVNGQRGGDCCEVIRTDVLKERKFPEYEGEKFLGEGYLWNYTGFNYDTVYINKVIYICEYLEGGLTKSGRAMRIRCPKGGMVNSNSFLMKIPGRRVRTKILHKEAILFVCYGKFAGLSISQIVKQCNRPWQALVDYLPGVLLYHFWKCKYGCGKLG